MPSNRFGKYTTNDWNCKYYLESVELAKEIILLFFKNNQYLLNKKGITLHKQVKELKSTGLRIDKINVYGYRSGKITSMNLTYLQFFCKYWGLKLKDMIYQDMEEWERMKSEANTGESE